MKHFLKKEKIETKEHTRVYDITSPIEKLVKESGFKEGHILIQPMHTTVGIYLNEGEKFLFKDLVEYLNKQVPQGGGRYRHDNIAERGCPDDEPENGHSHIKAAFYSNPSLSLILSKGKIQLGKYQRILFAEFDGPCPRTHKGKRRYLVSILGD